MGEERLRSLREFRIWQLLGLYQFQKRVAEQERIFSIVKPMLQFIQIGVEMLHRKLVIRADHAALEKAPDALNGVCVNVAANPFFFAVVNRFVARILVADVFVANPLIRIDRSGIRRGIFLNELFQQKTIRTFNDLQSNFAAALNRALRSSVRTKVWRSFAQRSSAPSPSSTRRRSMVH
jgi:hypothetical protein